MTNRWAGPKHKAHAAEMENTHTVTSTRRRMLACAYTSTWLCTLKHTITSAHTHSLSLSLSLSKAYIHSNVSVSVSDYSYLLYLLAFWLYCDTLHRWRVGKGVLLL